MSNNRKGNKKIALVLILKALEQSSDANHPIKQVHLAKMVNDIGGLLDIDVWCDRKTVGRHLQLLSAVGYNIVTVKGKGCYLESNKLTIIESDCLIELLEKSTLEKQDREVIVGKLKAQQSIPNREKIKSIFDKKK